MNDIAQKLAKLIQENPDLPVVPMVDSELILDDSHAYWMGFLNDCEIRYYYSDEEAECVWIKKLDEDKLIDRYIDYHEEKIVNLSNEEIDELAKKWIETLPWIKAIIVWISP